MAVDLSGPVCLLYTDTLVQSSDAFGVSRREIQRKIPCMQSLRPAESSIALPLAT
jgi:hypothetical protein